MRKDWKSIWLWVDIALFLLCVGFYLLANPRLVMSGAPRTSHLGYTLLALLCLAVKTVIDKKKLKEPAWQWNWEWVVIVLGTYLVFTLLK